MVVALAVPLSSPHRGIKALLKSRIIPTPPGNCPAQPQLCRATALPASDGWHERATNSADEWFLAGTDVDAFDEVRWGGISNAMYLVCFHMLPDATMSALKRLVKLFLLYHTPSIDSLPRTHPCGTHFRATIISFSRIPSLHSTNERQPS